MVLRSAQSSGRELHPLKIRPCHRGTWLLVFQLSTRECPLFPSGHFDAVLTGFGSMLMPSYVIVWDEQYTRAPGG